MKKVTPRRGDAVSLVSVWEIREASLGKWCLMMSRSEVDEGPTIHIMGRRISLY